MPTPNQIFRRQEQVSISATDLLNMKIPGSVTQEGIRKNLVIGLNYMEGWLRAVGCAPINNLMEDAATAEVSRSQVWYTLSIGKTHLINLELSCGNGHDMVLKPLRALLLLRSTTYKPWKML